MNNAAGRGKTGTEGGHGHASPEPRRRIVPGRQMIRVRVLSIYPPGTAPGARFRYEQFVEPLARRGIEVEISSFFGSNGYRAYRDGRRVAFFLAMLGGVLRCIGLVVRGPHAEIVWVHRQAMPIASRLVEWSMKHVWRRRVVFDFDDAVWRPQSDHHRLVHRLSAGGKIPRIIADADAVIAGNAFLAEYARAYRRDVTVIPTVVDTARRFNLVREHGPGPVTLVWTGSASTTGYLQALAPVLRAVQARRDVRFLFISDVFPPMGLERVEEVPWSEATEVTALARGDIGLMPLPDDEWARGKCGFKIIQYMALGLVPVASAVGANRDIIEDGIDGFLCRDEADWTRALLAAIDDVDLRRRIGRTARAKAEARYSLARQVDRLTAVLTGGGDG
jgi:glycosyltransferase involved in cell wall biosynthesis